MAVTKTEFQVNSGNTGWTAQHVLDALETALGPTGAGLHSGPSTTGVIRKILKVKCLMDIEKILRLYNSLFENKRKMSILLG